MFQPKRILVPMDFSEEAKLALDWAVTLSKETRGVKIFPAYIYPVLPDAAALDVGRSAYKEVEEEWVKDQMKTLQKKLSKKLSSEPVYAKGSPAEKIAEICRKKKVDLVVITTHGRKGISHLLHRSVAEGLVRLAPCPVVVLHLNQPS